MDLVLPPVEAQPDMPIAAASVKVIAESLSRFFFMNLSSVIYCMVMRGIKA
jgi:hypothetical protein